MSEHIAGDQRKQGTRIEGLERQPLMQLAKPLGGQPELKQAKRDVNPIGLSHGLHQIRILAAVSYRKAHTEHRRPVLADGLPGLSLIFADP